MDGDAKGYDPTTGICTYCHGIGACPHCWGRVGIDRTEKERDALAAQLAQAREALNAVKPYAESDTPVPLSVCLVMTRALSTPAPRVLTEREAIDLCNEAWSEGVHDGHPLAGASRYDAEKAVREALDGR